MKQLVGEPTKLKAEYARMIKGLEVLKATIQSKNEQTNMLSRGLVTAFGSFYYAVAGEEASLKTNIGYTKFDPNSTLELWQMGESKLVKPFVKLMIPAIQYKKIMHVAKVPVVSWETNTKFSEKPIMYRIFREKPFPCPIWHFTGPNVKNTPNTIKVRVMATSSPFDEPQTGLQAFCTLNLFSNEITPFHAKNVILHFHGGGFVSMSSFSMQVHTRV